MFLLLGGGGGHDMLHHRCRRGFVLHNRRGGGLVLRRILRGWVVIDGRVIIVVVIVAHLGNDGPSQIGKYIGYRIMIGNIRLAPLSDGDTVRGRDSRLVDRAVRTRKGSSKARQECDSTKERSDENHDR